MLTNKDPLKVSNIFFMRESRCAFFIYSQFNLQLSMKSFIRLSFFSKIVKLANGDVNDTSANFLFCFMISGLGTYMFSFGINRICWRNLAQFYVLIHYFLKLVRLNSLGFVENNLVCKSRNCKRCVFCCEDNVSSALLIVLYRIYRLFFAWFSIFRRC